ncbi:MAG: hypothetical protein ACK40D_08245 [Cyanobacteriota bacterium]
MRTLIDLPEPALQQLDALWRQRGISRERALRLALTLWSEHQQPSHAEVFGLWSDCPGDQHPDRGAEGEAVALHWLESFRRWPVDDATTAGW